MSTASIRSIMLTVPSRTSSLNVELTCTVSNLSSLRKAVENGANAVYVPYRCMEERGFERAIEHAQNHDCKVVLAVEEKATPASWDSLRNTIHGAVSCVDAMLFSDPALLIYAAAYYPGLPRYLQLSEWEIDERSIETAQRYAGIERLVLPRIIFMPHLEAFARNVQTEVEVIGFGQCAFIEGEALNDQAMTKPCNDAFDLLPRLVDMGINAVRIEADDSGTNSIGNVTRIWREAIDQLASRRPYRLELIS